MITLYFTNIEVAIEKLTSIRDRLLTVRNSYEALENNIKGNVDIENRMVRMGIIPRHRAINIQSATFNISIHLAPHYSWLFNKLNENLAFINFIINEIDKVISYLQSINARGASVALFIDYVNKRTKLVIMP
ncbi:hypothetical protein [Vulcanisaeta thermophila]|uniref:hypothetical protein n=1 Tax=Vulcanisaeta thermophila TaxID=867917 RepID=UPI0008534B0A|nr:hypothetical protein [Vulcanisaeta thermophila]